MKRHLLLLAALTLSIPAFAADPSASFADGPGFGFPSGHTRPAHTNLHSSCSRGARCRARSSPRHPTGPLRHSRG